MVPTKISNFHDGYFDGLWIGPNKLVQFFLTTVNQQSFVLILEGVQRLTLTDINGGNIILDLVLRGTEELTHSDVRDLYGGGSDLSDKPTASRRDALTRLLVEDILRERELRCARMAAYGRTGSTVREELHDYLGGLRVQLGAEERHLAADVWAGVLRD